MARRKGAKRGNKARARKAASLTVPVPEEQDVVTEDMAEEQQPEAVNLETDRIEPDAEDTESPPSAIDPEPSPSLDGDHSKDGSGTESEIMHTGFMQTGLNHFRCGSTIIDLDKADDETNFNFKRVPKDIALEVECGENKAMMYLSKLYQGSKGHCIEFQGNWITPNEFQAVSGRESAKDWKRSIRHQGRSLKLLLSKGVLDVHPAACRCDSCRLLQQSNGKTPSVDGLSGDESKKKVKCGSAKKRKKGKDREKEKEEAEGKVGVNGEVSAVSQVNSGATSLSTAITTTAPPHHDAAHKDTAGNSSTDSSSSSEDEDSSDGESDDGKNTKAQNLFGDPIPEPPKRVEAIKVKIPRNLPTNSPSSSDSSSSGDSSDDDTDEDGSSEDDDNETTENVVPKVDPASLNEPLFPDPNKPAVTIKKRPKKESSSEDDEPLACFSRKQTNKQDDPKTEEGVEEGCGVAADTAQVGVVKTETDPAQAVMGPKEESGVKGEMMTETGGGELSAQHKMETDADVINRPEPMDTDCTPSASSDAAQSQPAEDAPAEGGDTPLQTGFKGEPEDASTDVNEDVEMRETGPAGDATTNSDPKEDEVLQRAPTPKAVDLFDDSCSPAPLITIPAFLSASSKPSSPVTTPTLTPTPMAPTDESSNTTVVESEEPEPAAEGRNPEPPHVPETPAVNTTEVPIEVDPKPETESEDNATLDGPKEENKMAETKLPPAAAVAAAAAVEAEAAATAAVGLAVAVPFVTNTSTTTTTPTTEDLSQPKAGTSPPRPKTASEDSDVPGVATPDSGGVDASSDGGKMTRAIPAVPPLIPVTGKTDRKLGGSKLSRLSNIIDNLRVSKEKQVLTGDGEKADSPGKATSTPPLAKSSTSSSSSSSFAPHLLARPDDKKTTPGTSFTPPPTVYRHPSPHHTPTPYNPSLQPPSQPQTPSRPHHSPSPSQHSRKSTPSSSLSHSTPSSTPGYPHHSSSTTPSSSLTHPSSSSSSSSHPSAPSNNSGSKSSKPSSSSSSTHHSSAAPSSSSSSSSATTSRPSATTTPSSFVSLPSLLTSSPSLASASPLLAGGMSASLARQQEQLALSLQQAMARGGLTTAELGQAQLMAFHMAQNEAALQQAAYFQKVMEMQKMSSSMSAHSKAERDYQMAAMSALMPWPPRPDILNPFQSLAHQHILAAQQQQLQQQMRDKELEKEKQKQQQKQREREQQQKREREREREREQQKQRQEQLELKHHQQKLQEQQQHFKQKQLHMMQEQRRKLDAAHTQFQLDVAKRDAAKRPYDVMALGLGGLSGLSGLSGEQPRQAHTDAKKPRTSHSSASFPSSGSLPTGKPRPSHTKENGSSGGSGSSSSSSGGSRSGSSGGSHGSASSHHNPLNLPVPLPVSPVAPPRIWSSSFPHSLPAPTMDMTHLSRMYEDAAKHMAGMAALNNSRSAHTSPSTHSSSRSATASSSSSSSSSAPSAANPSSSSSSSSAAAAATSGGGGEVLDLSVSKR